MSDSTVVIASSLHCFGSHVQGRTVIPAKGERDMDSSASYSYRKAEVHGSKGKSPAAAEKVLLSCLFNHITICCGDINLKEYDLIT